jgi:hypothetical protein
VLRVILRTYPRSGRMFSLSAGAVQIQRDKAEQFVVGRFGEQFIRAAFVL